MNAVFHTLGAEAVDQNIDQHDLPNSHPEEFKEASEEASFEIELASLISKTISNRIQNEVTEIVHEAVSTAATEAINVALPRAVEAAVNKKLRAIFKAADDIINFKPADASAPKTEVSASETRGLNLGYLYSTIKESSKLSETFVPYKGVSTKKAHMLLSKLLINISRENGYEIKCRNGLNAYHEDVIDEACQLFKLGRIPNTFERSVTRFFKPVRTA